MPGTLYSYAEDFRTKKILLAAEYGGNKVTLDSNFVSGGTEKSAEFLKKFPFGKVPAFECGDVKLFDTNGIAYHVGNDQTRGGDKKAEVLQWIGFADNVIQPAACTWVFPTQGILQYNKQSTEKAKADIKAALVVLNDLLATRTYLVGQRVTQADISLACTLLMLYVHVMDVEFRQPFANVNRWFVAMISQPQFKAVCGEIKLCEKMAQFDPKKYNEIHGKANKMEKTPKQKSGAGDSELAEPKSDIDLEAEQRYRDLNPWDGMPASDFNVDVFKREFSNKSSSESEKHFWDHFDKENYSLWHASSKYNELLRPGLSSLNLVNFMLQRLTKMSKNAFAIIVILKKGNECKVEGLWFWRGHDLAFLRSSTWQTDYHIYEWTKLDTEAEETKSLVKEYFNCCDIKNNDRKIGDWPVVDFVVFT